MDNLSKIFFKSYHSQQEVTIMMLKDKVALVTGGTSGSHQSNRVSEA
ncbi:MAG: hypothetical protein ACHBN1_01300 [Heteroscytonema crispum UTEX LB 1556]